MVQSEYASISVSVDAITAASLNFVLESIKLSLSREQLSLTRTETK